MLRTYFIIVYIVHRIIYMRGIDGSPRSSEEEKYCVRSPPITRLLFVSVAHGYRVTLLDKKKKNTIASKKRPSTRTDTRGEWGVGKAPCARAQWRRSVVVEYWGRTRKLFVSVKSDTFERRRLGRHFNVYRFLESIKSNKAHHPAAKNPIM